MKTGSNTDDNPRSPSGRPVHALTGDVPPIARTGSSPLPSHLCSIRLSTALFVALLGVAASTPAESFFLATRSVEIPEAGRVTHSVLCSSRHELAFLPPRGWKESFDTNNLQLTWISRDYTSMLRLKISPSGQTPQLNADDLRQTIQQRYPKARVLEQFACYTSGGKGVAFDLEEFTEKNIKTSTRLAFVPYEAGLAEFTLAAPAEQFPQTQQLFSQFLNSFHVGARRR